MSETPPEQLEATSESTQEAWDKQKPEERETLLQEAHNPADPDEPPPPKADGDTPTETPETPPETDTAAETPKEEPLLAGKYKTPEELEKGYQELQTKLGTQGEELRQTRESAKIRTAPEPSIKPPDPFNEEDQKRWATEVTEVAKKQATEVAADLIQKNEAARPVGEMIGQFKNDHPDLSPAQRHGIALYADELANAAQKPVSLDEASENMASTLGGPPKTNEQTKSPVEDKVRAIKEANNVPKTLAQTPASTPPGDASNRVSSPREWAALPEEERDRRMREIGMPPDGA